VSDKADRAATLLLDALRSVLQQVAEPSLVLKKILGAAVSRTGADRAVFVEVGGAGELHYRVLYNFRQDQLSDDAAHFSRSIFAEVLRTGRAVRVDAAREDPRFAAKKSVQEHGLVSVLCMPIRLDAGIVALVHLESDRPGQFDEEHEALVESLLGLAAPALGAVQASESVLRERDKLLQSREELEQSREFLAHAWSFGRFVGRSPAVRQLAESVRKASRTEFPVLLLGETGTGKSILARVLHNTGPRAKHAFVTVFCPSLEKGMVESELFGHRRGAFTGAVVDRAGKVQTAEGGTLFLDEIGELPLEIQAKLLRLLQERTYERLGDATERRANVRIIAATNRDLEREVQAGKFRRDLYERLNFVPIRIPPLRERRQDIPLLLRHCLDQHESGRWVELTDEVAASLVELDFTWPGNVRHLEQLAARLSMDEPRGPVSKADLLARLDGASRAEPSSDPEAGLPARLAQVEKAWIEDALARYPDLPKADLAAKLGIGGSTLYKKLKAYRIEP
jgi:transcriptional regulator with GAF, ATPase, and Fis domain